MVGIKLFQGDRKILMVHYSTGYQIHKIPILRTNAIPNSKLLERFELVTHRS